MRLYETNLWKFLESHSQNSLDLAERLELSRKIIVEVEWYTYNMLIHRDLKERLRNSFLNSLPVIYNTVNYRFKYKLPKKGQSFVKKAIKYFNGNRFS